MEKVCNLCGKQLTTTVEYQFFPEDDSYICKDCLSKESKKEREQQCGMELPRNFKDKDWVAILDFGSQYTHLIARRMREFLIA